jgi:hypothetical protein
LPSEYCKTNILVDGMGFNPLGLRAATEMVGVDRVVYGSDFGAVPYGIKEYLQIVEDVLPSRADATWCSGRPATKIFRPGLGDTDRTTVDRQPARCPE